MNLILIGPADLPPPNSSSDGVAIDLPPDDDRTRHILGHLGKADGDTVSVGFVDPAGGRRCRAVVSLRRNGGVRLVCEPPNAVPSPPLPEITLLLVFPFPARLRYLWPVISSFAMVTRVVVVRSRLSNAEFAKSSALHPAVYGPAIEAGMSQGGRTRPVRVDVCPVDETISRAWMERRGLVRARRGGGERGDGDGRDAGVDDGDDDDDDDGTARIFLDCGDEGEVPPPARDVVLGRCLGRRARSGARPAPSAVLAVGPERGWTNDEARVFVGECGFLSATLGGSILRVDAAVVAGLGMVSAALDECVREGRGGSDDGGNDARRKGTKRDNMTMAETGN
jgi:16S rRNA U1498 N3-methylase RsmE